MLCMERLLAAQILIFNLGPGLIFIFLGFCFFKSDHSDYLALRSAFKLILFSFNCFNHNNADTDLPLTCTSPHSPVIM